MTRHDTRLFTDLSTIAERRHRAARRAQSEQLRLVAGVIWQWLARRAGTIAVLWRQSARAVRKGVSRQVRARPPVARISR